MKKRVVAFVLVMFAICSVAVVVGGAGDSAASIGRKDPYVRYRFLVEIDGIAQAGFMKIEGLNVTLDVIEYREGNEPATPRKIPGLAHYGPLILRYGITDSMELWDWMKDTIDGEEGIRRNIAVIILDRKGNPAARYELLEAWPSGWGLGKLDGLSSRTVIEELIIQYEEIERVA